MVLILGATNFLGHAFAVELQRRRVPFVPISREALDFSRFDLLFDYLRHLKPAFVINAESFWLAHELNGLVGLDRILAHAELSQTIARACSMTRTAWAHVSSGGIYRGARILTEDGFHIEPDLTREEVLQHYGDYPERFRGFSETELPNPSPEDLLARSTLAGEEALRGDAQAYVWRMRMIFSDVPEPWNLLWRMAVTPNGHDGLNSVSHLDDCVRACLNLWQQHSPYGIYHIANPGPIRTRQVLATIRRAFKHRNLSLPSLEEHSWNEDPSRACLLDTSKLDAAGVRLRSATTAIEEALGRWPEQEPSNVTRVLFAK